MIPELFTDEHRTNVCKIGQGSDCCRYLAMGSSWKCLKKTSMASSIDFRIDKMAAKGDNCEGVWEPRQSYRLTKDRFGHPAGTIVYEAAGYDYGMCRDDEQMTGEPHTSMTLDPAGGYPSFTVPNSGFKKTG